MDLSGLTDETCYEVEVVFNPSVASSAISTPSSSTASGSSESASATFTTAPRPSATRAVRGQTGGGWKGGGERRETIGNGSDAHDRIRRQQNNINAQGTAMKIAEGDSSGKRWALEWGRAMRAM